MEEENITPILSMVCKMHFSFRYFCLFVLGATLSSLGGRGLHVVLCSEVTPGHIQGTICGAEDSYRDQQHANLAL